MPAGTAATVLSVLRCGTWGAVLQPAFHRVATMSQSSLPSRKAAAFAAVAAVAALSLSACGGGGDGDASATPPTIPPAPSTPSPSPSPAPSPSPSPISGAWGTPQLVEADAATVAAGQKLVVAPNGKAVAVWLQERTSGSQTLYSVHARAYSPDTGWGAATGYNLSGTDDAGKPQVAINASGDAIVVWVQSGTNPGTSRDFNIASVRYSAATGSWDAAPAYLLGVNEIPQAYSVDMDSHSITLDDSGNSFYAIANRTIFNDPDGAWVKQYRNGAWTDATRFLPGASSEGRDIALAATPTGNAATALWKQYDNTGSKYRILASEYRDGSGWTAGHVIDGDLAQSYGPARIAIAANGDTLAVWEASTSGGSRTDLYAARLTGSAWSPPAIIGGDALGPIGYLAGLCSDASGNAVLATLPSADLVAVTRFSVASGWGTAERVPPADQSFTVPQASVGCNTRGDAMVSYRAMMGSNNSYQLWARPYVAGSGWGTAAQIVALPAGGSLALAGPVTGLDDSFRSLTLWRQDQQPGIALNKPQDLWSAVFQ